MYFILICIVSSPVIWGLVATTDPEPHPLSDEFIDIINKEGKWKAGRNFHPDTPMEDIRRLMGTLLSSHESTLPLKTHDPDLINKLPETFDARTKWPFCPSLKEIRDQGSCGSCWAFAAVEAMTDRYCIFSNGTENFHFSAEDLTSCETSSESNGCGGGNPSAAWKFWSRYGLVSGGGYGSNEGCRPYSFPECSHHTSGSRPNCTEYKPTPPCVKACRDGYNVSYANDKRYGDSTYELSGENAMKAEIFLNGPIESSFAVHADFITYKKGVYEHIKEEVLGGHAVKILGWGVEDGKKYWLVANSWNSEWGDGGYFKIKRGTDESGIESYLSVAGRPKVERL